MARPSKVTVLLRGGLGNQMFQYAAGLAVASKYNTRLILDTTYLNDRFPRKQFTFRTYDLDIFDLQPEFSKLSKLSAGISVPGLWLGFDLASANFEDILGIQKFVKEKKEFVYDPEIFAPHKNILLWGYWQTEKYFSAIASEVRKAFSFKYPLDGEAAELGALIQKVNSVSLHVRRADYLLPKYQSTYGNTNTSFYDRAVAYIKERVKDPEFFIFSDDIAWCRENIKLPFPTNYVERSSEGLKANFHLQLMSMCKHNIITNSTYSWWGAWLNKNIDKIVIAPERWSPASQGDEEIIPTGWIRL